MDQPKTFLERYNETIAPKLKDIDIFIKHQPKKIEENDMARLLYISENEVEEIIAEKNIDKITTDNFFIIMKNGSSEICEIFKRQLECGFPKKYSPEDISYIYDIDIETVLEASKNIGVKSFNKITMQILFSIIYI